jgi:hypothetical protein
MMHSTAIKTNVDDEVNLRGALTVEKLAFNILRNLCRFLCNVLLYEEWCLLGCYAVWLL